MSGPSEEFAEAEKANDDAAAAELAAGPKRRRRRAVSEPKPEAERVALDAADSAASSADASENAAEPTDAELEAAAERAAAEDPAATAPHDAPVGAEANGVAAPAKSDAEPARDWSDLELAQAIEAMLFASHEPLTHGRLAQVLSVTQRRVRNAIERLREEYLANARAFDVLEIAGGFKLYTRPEYDELVARLEKVKPPEKLTASGLETLAIVAYKQPITRAQIDAIRGVHSGAMLKTLTEKKLIRVAGRAEQPGRPIQYGTTKRFLDHFGLASVEDLPRVEDLKAP
jgi:segregation and condensation protein B